MRRTAAFIIALTLTGVGLAATTPADAATCNIDGAQKATWGCGRVTSSSRIGGTVRLQDTKTDGRCIRVKIKTDDGTWADQGISHCSSKAASYSFSPASGSVNGIRIYKGWSGSYRTLSF